MGGFLSPVKAIATCSRREQLLMLMRPGGIVTVTCRYMDDVFILAAYENETELYFIDAFFAYVGGTSLIPGGGYPAPLELNVEPEALVENFLELQIRIVGSRVDVILYNKVIPALLKGDRQLTRLPDEGDATTFRDRMNWVTGYLHRVKAGCTDIGMVREAIGNLALELQHATMLKYLGWALRRILQKEKDENDERFWVDVVGVTAL